MQATGQEPEPYLPILGLPLEHHGILGLADIAVIILFNLLGTLLSLDSIVF